MTDSVESVLQKSREEFEKWAKGPQLPLPQHAGLYVEYMTHVAWLAWQASRSALEPMLRRYEDDLRKMRGTIQEQFEAFDASEYRCDRMCAQLGNALQAIAEGPMSKECGYCHKTNSFSGAERIKISNHREECPVRIATEALSPSPTPAQDFIWTCSACRMRIQTVIKFHVNQRPVCVQCNAEMEPAKPSPDSPAPLPHKVEYLRAKEPGLCIICAARIHTGELIHIGGSGGVPVAAHHECVQTNHADAQKYNMLGGHSS